MITEGKAGKIKWPPREDWRVKSGHPKDSNHSYSFLLRQKKSRTRLPISERTSGHLCSLYILVGVHVVRKVLNLVLSESPYTGLLAPMREGVGETYPDSFPLF